MTEQEEEIHILTEMQKNTDNCETNKQFIIIIKDNNNNNNLITRMILMPSARVVGHTGLTLLSYSQSPQTVLPGES